MPQMAGPYHLMPPSPAISITLITPRVAAFDAPPSPIFQGAAHGFGPFQHISSSEMDAEWEDDDAEMDWTVLAQCGT